MCADREFERALVLDAGRIWRQMGTRADDEYGRASAVSAYARWRRRRAGAGYRRPLASKSSVRWRWMRACIGGAYGRRKRTPFAFHEGSDYRGALRRICPIAIVGWTPFAAADQNLRGNVCEDAEVSGVRDMSSW